MSAEPTATYRIQLHESFTFDDVAGLGDYFADLGISHLYLSPYLEAVAGSTHGYDTVDHSTVREELGGLGSFGEMVDELRAHGLGHVADLVPNHMAMSPRNRWWWDVLKHGPSSRFARWFDIDWEANGGRVMLGILDDSLEAVLARGELRRDTVQHEPLLRYFDRLFPLAPGTERTGDILDLIERQNYSLVDRRYAARNLNYRRFFDVDELVGLNVNVQEVFEAVHAVPLGLIREGKVDGLRVDHIDGLRDPQGYLMDLRRQTEDLYLIVEKILEPQERLPDTWPVEGTVGYDFLNDLLGLFVASDAEHALSDLYKEFTGVRTDPKDQARRKKLFAMRFLLPADLSRLAAKLERIFQTEGWEADDDVLRVALAETIAELDVYRTYITPAGLIRDEDRSRLESAIAAARRTSFLDDTHFDRLRSVLLLERGGEEGLDFVLRLQQTTGAVMAKGIEDTFFYSYVRFVALNEVGGDPTHFGISTEDFHARAQAAAERASRSMLATSTHDTKRSEDVRARLVVLSEIPDRWAAAIRGWWGLAAPHRSDAGPDRNTEYLWWQTICGAWPLDVERAVAYMLKAAREAKERTSWHSPNEAYEEALEGFVRGVCADQRIVAAIEDFVTPLIGYGRINSLSQTLVKLTHPGVPDTYQGSETWDLSLVDPDNRRPVDYEALRTLLEKVKTTNARDLWTEPDDGGPKMLVTTRTLALRKRLPEVFSPASSYEPLEPRGAKADHVVAYLRGRRVAVIVPRLVVTLEGDWQDTRVFIPTGTWYNELTSQQLSGGEMQVAPLLSDFPVALLSSR